MNKNTLNERGTYQSLCNPEYSGSKELLIDEKFLNNYKNSIVIKILETQTKSLSLALGLGRLLKIGK